MIEMPELALGVLLPELVLALGAIAILLLQGRGPSRAGAVAGGPGSVAGGPGSVAGGAGAGKATVSGAGSGARTQGGNAPGWPRF